MQQELEKNVWNLFQLVQFIIVTAGTFSFQIAMMVGEIMINTTCTMTRGRKLTTKNTTDRFQQIVAGQTLRVRM